MSTHCISFNPADAAPRASEPLESAVLEVSGRIVETNVERRRLHSRLDELRSGDPGLRRSRPRVPPSPLTPVTFYSIEEVA
jgi:hypothetical protein